MASADNLNKRKRSASPTCNPSAKRLALAPDDLRSFSMFSKKLAHTLGYRDNLNPQARPNKSALLWDLTCLEQSLQEARTKIQPSSLSLSKVPDEFEDNLSMKDIDLQIRRCLSQAGLIPLDYPSYDWNCGQPGSNDLAGSTVLERTITGGAAPGLGGTGGRGGNTGSSKVPIRAWTRMDFTDSTKVGKGGFATVYSARIRGVNSGGLIALKVMKKADINEHDRMDYVLNEYEIHAKLRHPNIVELHQMFMDTSEVYLMMEYVCGGPLTNLMRKPLEEEETIRIIHQVAKAVDYIHDCGIVHRDLKPANILITSTGVIKIADFGISASIGQGLHRICGTPAYMPPEALGGIAQTVETDQWALGIIIYECLRGVRPFRNTEREELFKEIQSKNPLFFDPKDLPAGARDLVKNVQLPINLTVVLVST
ncbi:hypothetical protein FRC11_003976 [Ceratobasidium sp. 423]|nr:hypothetical protein FRC11_003976 [Ceratobasidium sp. 423]